MEDGEEDKIKFWEDKWLGEDTFFLWCICYKKKKDKVIGGNGGMKE